MHDSLEESYLLYEGDSMNWDDEVKELAKTIKPSRPYFKLVVAGGGINGDQIKFLKTAIPTSDSDSRIVVNILLHFSREHLVDGKHEIAYIESSATAQVWKIVNNTLMDLLIVNLPYKNIRLTSIYRWYDENMNGLGNTFNHETYMNFQNDIYALWKYIWDRDKNSLTETDVQNGLGLLQVIKDKYGVIK